MGGYANGKMDNGYGIESYLKKVNVDKQQFYNDKIEISKLEGYKMEEIQVYVLSSGGLIEFDLLEC